MSLPNIADRAHWVQARVALLEREKALTRARDDLNADRRRLPMVRVEKDYRFEGPQGEATLLDVFAGRSQLIVGHFMFDPESEDGCPSCSAGVDERAAGHFAHLAARDTTLVYVSRAPLAKLDRWQRVKGWSIPWYSSHGSDFNYDFGVTLDPDRGFLEHNYRAVGPGMAGEFPGTSVFLRLDGDVFTPTPATPAARGAEDTASSYQLLDLTALGRQEEWEQPAGRAEAVRSARPGFES